MFQLTSNQLDALQKGFKAQTPERLEQALVKSGLKCTYHAGERLLKVLAPDGATPLLDLSFLEGGSPEALTLAAGSCYAVELDEKDRLRSLTYPSGDRVMWEPGPHGPVTFGRPGGAYRLEYDSGGRLTGVKDPLGGLSQYQYDSAGRLESTVDRLGRRVQYERHSHGLSRIDPLGRKLDITFAPGTTGDADGLSRITYPDGTFECFDSSEKMRSRWITSRDGSVMAVGSDPAGKVETVQYALGWSLLFSHAGEHLGAVERRTPTGRVRVQLEHDQRGLLLQEEGLWGKVNATYDAQGRCIKLVGPHQLQYEYQYDAEGRLITASTAARTGLNVQYSNAAFDRTYSNGARETWKFEPMAEGLPHMCRQELRGASGLNILTLEYQYDALERLVRRKEAWGTGDQERQQLHMVYDAEHQLLQVLGTDTDPPIEQYAYDAVGNMVMDGPQSRQYGPLDVLERAGDQEVRCSARGQILSWCEGAEQLQLEYGPDNTLLHVSRGETRWHGTYDGLGRRIQWSNGVGTWRYGWWGHQLLWESYQETPSSPWKTRTYFWLPDGVTPVGFREEGREYFLIHDARGAVVRALDELGRSVWSGRYDSFGALVHEEAEVRQPWRLSGMYKDEGTGLYFTLARAYSPRLKCWLSPDPLWSEDPASPYRYARQDPWNRVDPSGQLAPLIVAGVGAVVGGVIGAGVALATGGDPVAGAVGGAVTGVASAFVGAMAAAGAITAGVAAVLGFAASALGAAAEELTRQLRDDEPWCFKCLVSSVVASVLTDLALLGLGKIPGVKSLAKRAGDALAALVNKIPFVKKLLSPHHSPSSQGVEAGVRQATRSLAKPSDKADEAALAVVNVLNDVGTKKERSQTIGVIEDAEGRVWVAVSGDQKSAAKVREKLMNDPRLKDKGYSWAEDAVDTSHFTNLNPVVDHQGVYVKQGKDGVDNNCVEAKLYSTQTSPENIKGMTVIRGENGKNAWPTQRAKDDPIFAQELCPCASCALNQENILNMATPR